jgi:predicted protein tyrosine phosphatase
MDARDIVALSEDNVQRYECDVPHVVISITGPGCEFPVLPENPNRRAVLRLAFHDIDGTKGDSVAAWLRSHNIEPVAMTEEQGEQVRVLLAQHQDIDAIIVNCQAGMSRSVGAAAAISKTLTGDDSQFFERRLNAHHHPNMLVYRTVFNAMNKERTQE